MSALRSPAGCGRGTVSRLRLAHDAAFYYRTSGSRGRLSPPFASCGSSPVSTGISQEPLCPLSCLAKYFTVGSLSCLGRHGSFSFERRCRGGFSPFRNSGVAGHVVLMDRADAQSVARRTFRNTAIRPIGHAAALEGCGNFAADSVVSQTRREIFSVPLCLRGGFDLTTVQHPLDILLRIVQNNRFIIHLRRPL